MCRFIHKIYLHKIIFKTVIRFNRYYGKILYYYLLSHYQKQKGIADDTNYQKVWKTSLCSLQANNGSTL